MSILRDILHESSAVRVPDAFHEFAHQMLRPRGESFSIAPEGPYGFLDAIYRDERPHQVFRKAAQMGLSTRWIGGNLHWAIRGHRCLYYLPSKEDMRPFVQWKVNPLINAHPALAQAVSQQEVAIESRGRRKRADNLTIIQAGKGFCGFLGLATPSAVRSLEADVVVIDEASVAARQEDPELRISLVKFAQDRLLASRLGVVVELSQPGVPGMDIDEAFQRSDAKSYVHWCRRGHEVVLEDAWPSCLKRSKDGWVLACPRCGSHIYRQEDVKVFVGKRREWVARSPGAEASGWHLSQLYGPARLPVIARAWQLAQQDAEEDHRFHISILGKPKAGKRQPITDQVVKDCSLAVPVIRQTSGQFSLAGVDFGKTVWFMAGQWQGGRLRILDYGGDRDVGAVRRRLLDLNAAAVIDALPERREAVRLATGLRAGMLCEFGDWATTLRDGEELLDDGSTALIALLRARRVAALDDAVDLLLEGKVVFPATHPLHETLRSHLKNLVRDPANNAWGYTYRPGVENHLGVCLAYLLLATVHGREVGFYADGVSRADMWRQRPVSWSGQAGGGWSPDRTSGSW